MNYVGIELTVQPLIVVCMKPLPLKPVKSLAVKLVKLSALILVKTIVIWDVKRAKTMHLFESLEDTIPGPPRQEDFSHLQMFQCGHRVEN